MSMLIDNSLWWSGSLCACYLGMVDASMAPALAYLVDIRWGIPCSLELFLSEPGALFHFRFVFQEIFLAKWKRSLPSRRMVSFSFRNLICGLIVRSKSLCDDVQSQKKKKKTVDLHFSKAQLQKRQFCANGTWIPPQPVEKEKAVRRTSQVCPFVPKKIPLYSCVPLVFQPIEREIFFWMECSPLLPRAQCPGTDPLKLC